VVSRLKLKVEVRVVRLCCLRHTRLSRYSNPPRCNVAERTPTMSQRANLILEGGGFNRNASIVTIDRPEFAIYTGNDI